MTDEVYGCQGSAYPDKRTPSRPRFTRWGGSHGRPLAKSGGNAQSDPTSGMPRSLQLAYQKGPARFDDEAVNYRTLRTKLSCMPWG